MDNVTATLIAITEGYKERLRIKGKYRDLEWLQARIDAFLGPIDTCPTHVREWRIEVAASLREILNREAGRRPLSKEERKMALSIERMKEENSNEIKALNEKIAKLQVELLQANAELDQRMRVHEQLSQKTVDLEARELPDYTKEVAERR